jgi:4-hydroxy-tetrahydrodipicolinate synthase
MIKGSIVAIVSPMHEDGSLDLQRYRQLIDWHVAEGTAAIVAVGTTGESPTVDVDEHSELIRVAVEQVAGRIPIIAGTGGNSTREAIELTRFAAAVGAKASLQVVPYYNKPSQEGLYRHFKAVAEAVDLPQILYNVPGRTVADMSNDTVCGWPGARHRRLEGCHRRPAAQGRTAGAPAGGFAVWQQRRLRADGGGRPRRHFRHRQAAPDPGTLCAAALAGDFVKAYALNRELIPLHMKLFVEANRSISGPATDGPHREESGCRSRRWPRLPPDRARRSLAGSR